MICTRKHLAVLTLAAVAMLSRPAAGGPYDPPIDYYSGATGTGTTLKTELRSIISTMTGVSYGNARFSAPYTDTDPNNPNNILLIYNRASVDSDWDNAATWNREHIWPDSRLGAGGNDPSNSYVGIASDQFNLRPCNTGINGNRANSPFGNETTTGNYGYVGSNWYPGDADAGDVARSQFYMATRWSQLSLTDAVPSGAQMGDLSSLVNYHYRDVPDDFERRRNHAIFGLPGDESPGILNPYRQQNRNPYVDHPEWVWSVFVDQENDSQLYVGAEPNADGSSVQELDLDRVIVGAPLPSPQNVTLTKNGLDGTYYEVTTSGLAASSVTGRLNAFPVITSGTSSNVLSVGLNTDTDTPGSRQGTVEINNLDITTNGGAGRGSNDGNDVINVSLDVLAHANPSFALASDENTLNYDFGTITLDSMVPGFQFDIANLVDTLGYTAKLELDSIVPSGDDEQFLVNLSPFMGEDALEADSAASFFASIITDTDGIFSASYTLNFSDEDLPGATDVGSLTLNLTGTVEAAEETADFDGDGDVDGADFLAWQRGGSPNALSESDLVLWQTDYGAGPLGGALAVPEPSALVLAMLSALFPQVMLRKPR